MAVEGPASVCDDGLEIVEGIEAAVDDGLVEDGPERLGRLEFGRIGGQEDEPDGVWHVQVGLGVPARSVEHQDDAALWPGPRLAGKGGEQGLEEGLGDAVGEIPEDLAGGGLDEGGDVEPLEAVMAERDGALATGRPDPPCDRLQADAVLVGGKDLDRPLRMSRGFFGDDLGQLFLKASLSSGVAEAGFLGRGRCKVQPIARKASQPRCGATRSSPSSQAIQAATLTLVHKPPSGGDASRRSPSRSRSVGVSTVGGLALCRRWSPSEEGPCAL